MGNAPGASLALGALVCAVLGARLLVDAPPLRWRCALGEALRAGWMRQATREACCAGDARSVFDRREW